MMFDKKKKKCVKRINLVTDESLYNRQDFYKVEIVFYSSSVLFDVFNIFWIFEILTIFDSKLINQKENNLSSFFNYLFLVM